MKIQNFIDWWTENRGKFDGILWILPKKLRGWVNAVIAYIDFTIDRNANVMRSSFDTREVLPCIRTNPDGSTTLINCKTGVEIPKKD
jgi:hypothetical protein